MKEKSSETTSSKKVSGTDDKFYKLIPKGRTVEEQPAPQSVDMSESEKTRTLNEFYDLNNKLQNAFGYRNPRQSELEEAFYIKPWFILNNGIPKKDTGTAIMLLVAERDVFFKDADDNYRTRYVNRGFLSDRRSAARELKQTNDDEDSIQNWLIESSLRKAFHLWGDATMESDSRADVGLARKILCAVIHKAKSGRQGVYQWLYSRNRVKPSENNRAYYEAAYMTFSENPDEDGYVDTSRVFPENRDEQNRFIQALRDKGRPFQTGTLDVEVCKQDFQALVPECKENPLCSGEFYDKVILCLAEYISHERQIRYRFPEDEDYIDNERIFRNYGGFKARYEQIHALEDAFLHTERSYPGLPKSIEIDWKTEETDKDDRAKEIISKIEEYCRQADIPGKWGKECKERVDAGIFRSGIEWILNPPRRWKILQDDALKPIVILSFILSFPKRIEKDSTIEIFPNWSKSVCKAKQRLNQIKLLDMIHSALNLPWALCVKSWNEYLLRQGKAIQSACELSFWLDKLRGDYEKLPIIGFQLCFMDFCRDCMSPHIERLSYASLSEAQNTAFLQFYFNNPSTLQDVSAQLAKRQDCEVKKSINEYCAWWKSPGKSNKQRREVIQSLYERLQNDTGLVFQEQSDEFNLLAIEAAIRLLTIEKAQDKLVDWFDKTYGCAIKKLRRPKKQKCDEKPD